MASTSSSLSEDVDTKKMNPATAAHTSSPASSIHETQAAKPDFQPTTRFYLAFVALAVLTLMVALDGTSISVAIPIIAERLHGSALEAFWSGTGFLLASTVFQPSFASFSHIFGRVPMIMIAITFFFVGVMLAALAHNFIILLAGRAIQGIGGGGIIAMTEIVVTDLVPLRYRGQWAGIIGGMWAIGSVSGPVIGGVFAQKVTWRWIFYLNLPFIGVSAVMIPLFLRLNFVSTSLASKLRRVDWLGSVVFVGSMSSLLIPLTWGGVMYEWSSWRTLVPLMVGVVGLIVFALYEIYLAKEPLIRLSIFANRTINLAYVNTIFHGMILWCILFYQPLYFEGVRGFTPTLAGVALFPASFTVAPMSIITGFSITYLGRYRWSIWTGWAIATLGLGLLILLDLHTKTVAWIFIDLVSGIGLGILFPALQFQVQASAPAKDVAWAVAIFSFFRAVGQTLGVAVGGVIFQNQMVKNLHKYPQYAAQASTLAKDAAALVQVIAQTADQGNKLILKTAYTDSIRTIYIVMCAIAAVAGVLSLFVKEYDLNTAHETEQGLMSGKRGVEDTIEEGEKNEQDHSARRTYHH